MEYLDSSVQIIEFLKRTKPLAVLFYSDWCPFSIMMKTSFESVEHCHPKIVFGKVRLDVVGPDESLFPVSSIPTLALSYRGLTVDSFVGVLNPHQLSTRLAKFQANIAGTVAPCLGVPNFGGNYNYIFMLRVSQDLTRYRAGSQLKVIEVATAKEIGGCPLDRTDTHILLFFDYVREHGFETGLFSHGHTTTKCQRLLRDFKRDRNLGAAKLHGIEKPDADSDAKYLSKQLSKLNRKIAGGTGFPKKAIQAMDGEYRLADDIRIHITGQ